MATKYGERYSPGVTNNPFWSTHSRRPKAIALPSAFLRRSLRGDLGWEKGARMVKTARMCEGAATAFVLSTEDGRRLRLQIETHFSHELFFFWLPVDLLRWDGGLKKWYHEWWLIAGSNRPLPGRSRNEFSSARSLQGFVTQKMPASLSHFTSQRHRASTSGL